jgi:hypothetical protein
MAIPVTVRAQGGPFDLVIQIGNDTTKRYGFITRPGSQEMRITDFMPNVREGGDAAFTYSPNAFPQIVYHSFHHGGDKLLYESGDKRYQWSNGQVALHREGIVSLASQWNTTDSGKTATAREIVDFDSPNGSYICLGVGTTVRAYNTVSATWGNQGSFSSNVLQIYPTDTYLFIALGGSAYFNRWDGTSGGGMTTPGNQYARAFSMYRQSLYRAYGNNIYASTDNGGTWGSAIAVGWNTTSIYDIYAASGYLIIAKPEGMYAYDGSNVYELLNAETIRSTGLFVGGCEWNGAVYLPRLNTVQQAVISSVTSMSFTDITPYMKGDYNKERYGHGFARRCVAGPDHLYVAFDDGESVYPELLRYTGIGWHQLYRGASGDTMNAAGYSRLMGWLLINDGATRYKRLTNLSGSEYPDYNTSGLFTTPAYDGGYPDIIKSWRDITIDARDVNTSNTIGIEYSADDGAWTSIGTIVNTGLNTFTIDGINTQKAAYKMAFRFTLTRDAGDATDTPIIEMPLVIRAAPRPVAQHAQNFTIVMDVNAPLRNGYGKVGDAYTVEQMKEFIDELEDATNTLLIIDEFGGRSYMFNSDYARQVRIRDPLDTDDEVTGISLTFAEVFSGISRTVMETMTVTETATTALTDTESAFGTSAFGFCTFGETA